VLFLGTLPAEFIANDEPLVMSYKGELYYPVLFYYPETTFGGDFETEADYKDPYIVEKIMANGWMVMPLLPYDHQTLNFAIDRAPSAPSRENLLGVDDQGRDVLARLIYGFRLSVLFALTLTILSSTIGILAGAVQGYFGGWVDLALQRLIEIWQGLPMLFMLIILASFVEPNFWWLLGLLLLFSWTSLVGVVRAEFLRARNLDYVRAARSLGVRERVIMLRHVLPNALVAALTFLPFKLTAAVTTLTSLDFLGFGLPPGSPSLGELLAQGKNNPLYPWLGITGFVVVAVLLVLMIFIGEGLRDAMNPYKGRASGIPADPKAGAA
jgi:microcin C transport system permease protein